MAHGVIVCFTCSLSENTPVFFDSSADLETHLGANSGHVVFVGSQG